MSRPAEPVVEPPGDALARHRAAAPEAPFLFFRDPRGHFAWWSWERAQRALGGDGAVALEGGAAAALSFLAALLQPPPGAVEQAAALASAIGTGATRDIWLTRGDLAAAGEGALGLVALRCGWAVVHDPGAALHAATFLWARPTIAGGAQAELERLFAGCEAEAPRWRAATWLRRRVARLRVVAVAGEACPERLAEPLRRLGATARLLSNPGGGW